MEQPFALNAAPQLHRQTHSSQAVHSDSLTQQRGMVVMRHTTFMQLPSIQPSCFATTERETASTLLLFSRYSDAMFVVVMQTLPHGNGPIACLFAVLFLLGQPRGTLT